MTRQDKIRNALSVLAPTCCEIIDESHLHAGHGGFDAEGSHFFLTIGSPVFEGKTLLACHRLVYEALSEIVPREVHALRIEIIF